MTYFFILPYSLAFTIEFSFNILGLDVYRPEAGNYYSTVIWMTFAVGIAFQFPLVLILLVKIGILSVKKLRDNRRLVLVILLISAAFITPGGDPVTLCILTVPLRSVRTGHHCRCRNREGKRKTGMGRMGRKHTGTKTTQAETRKVKVGSLPDLLPCSRRPCRTLF